MQISRIGRRLFAIGLSAVCSSSVLAGTAFTYQGRLESGGQAANGLYDFSFRLFSDATIATPIGSSFFVDDVEVTDGLFSVKIDFGANFDGNPRWLGISVRPGAQTGFFTVLSPRQELTSTPHAAIADKFTVPMFVGGTTDEDIFGPKAIMNVTQFGSSESIRAIHMAASGFVSALYGETHSSSGRAVEGNNTSTSGSSAFGVQGMTDSATSGAAGVRGVANGGGTSMTYGVRGETTSTGGTGVYGYGGKYGVYGLATAGGIDSVGVLGITNQNNGVGVTGRASGGGGNAAGILGQAPNGGWAGFFEGDVRVAGLLWANEKDFLIDNPANPDGEYLVHACVESDERRNLYDGIVTLGQDGTADVQLPAWFDSLNADYRYQLTCVGGYAAVFVAQEIQDDHFVIGGGKPGMKVSWQVTGVRVDPYARANPFRTVYPKAAADQGMYLDAAAHGKGNDRQLQRMPNLKARAADQATASGGVRGDE